MLNLFIGKKEVPVEIFKFPAGESGIKCAFENDPYQVGNTINVHITLDWQGNDDIINLALLVDAVKRKYSSTHLALSIPYFPYARQDRVCNKGESLSVKVVASIINSMEFDGVYVLDPHSDVLGSVLNNMITLEVAPRVAKAVGNSWPAKSYLVAPDAGALKKVRGYAKHCKVDGVIFADKVRDTTTGAITGTKVYSEHLGDASLLVADDILDGGGTFIPLAAELRKITTGKVSLMVSHGLFTKGVDIFQGVYDNIFVINNMYGPHPLITEI